jgi:hypothetical protein
MLTSSNSIKGKGLDDFIDTDLGYYGFTFGLRIYLKVLRVYLRCYGFTYKCTTEIPFMQVLLPVNISWYIY